EFPYIVTRTRELRICRFLLSALSRTRKRRASPCRGDRGLPEPGTRAARASSGPASPAAITPGGDRLSTVHFLCSRVHADRPQDPTASKIALPLDEPHFSQSRNPLLKSQPARVDQ